MTNSAARVSGEPGTFGVIGGILDRNGLGRFIPEPRSSAARTFQAVLGGAARVLGTGAAGMPGIDPLYQDFIDKQIEIQLQMQLVSLESNIEKSRHETQMAAIRNVRTG